MTTTETDIQVSGVNGPRLASSEVITDAERMFSAGPRWDNFDNRSEWPTSDYAWTLACAQTFQSCGQLRILVAREPNHVAIAPLVQKGRLCKRLEMLGAAELFEPCEFPHTGEGSLAELAGILLDSGLPVHLPRVPAASPTVRALVDACRYRAFVVRRPASSSPWLSLDESWTTPEFHLSARRRSDLRRAMKRAIEKGPVTFDTLIPTEDNVEEILKEAEDVELRSWKGREGSALACDPVRSAFFHRYAALAARKSMLHISFLRIGGIAAAMQIAIRAAGRFWLLKVGYDEAFARCSPGILLTVHTIQHAASLGLKSYEFLGKVEAWTDQWSDHVHECVSLRLYPYTFSGMIALASEAASVFARKAAAAIHR